MNNQKITVITICYNAASVIEKTIQSVINQTYGNIEYIIIDGASTDGTMDIVNKYRDRISIVVSEPDKGIYDAMNKGIRLATGEWINFMNAGDIFVDKNVVSSIFCSNDMINDYDIIFGDSIEMARNEEIKHICSSDSNNLLKGPTYRHGSSFVKSSVHKVNMFEVSRVDLGFALDYLLIHTLKVNNYRFFKVNLFVMKYEKEGVSSDIKKSALYILRITIKNKPLFAIAKYTATILKAYLGLYK